MRSVAGFRQKHISGTLDYARPARNHNVTVVNVRGTHQAPTDTGCICSDGKYHRCLDCIERDCIRTEEEIRRLRSVR
jgi:hypothetical protein